MSFGRAFRIAAIVLGAITLVLVVVEVVVVVRTRTFLAESTTTTGEVVGIEPRQSGDEPADERGGEREVRTTVYAPRVALTAADGRQIAFVPGAASGSPQYAEGDSVPVRYRPGRPARAKIDTVMDVWFGAILLGFFVVVLGGLPAVRVVLAVRSRSG